MPAIFALLFALLVPALLVPARAAADTAPAPPPAPVIPQSAPPAPRPGAALLAASPSPADFPLATKTAVARIHFSDTDARVVSIAARDLAADIERVTGKRPEVVSNSELQISNSPAPAVIIGTLGHSPLIDRLAASGKLDVTALRGAWETFIITMPAPRTLVIAGSDPRGTAYGAYELSQAIGVSPWHWWADVAPEKKPTLHVAAGAHLRGPPSVKYRGIFINDEDWGLQPWAAKTFEPENGGIGPKTYEKVFDLLLRLKANTLWPAMRECSPAFDGNPANATLSSDYAIIIGSPDNTPADVTHMLTDDGFGYIRHSPKAENLKAEGLKTHPSQTQPSQSQSGQSQSGQTHPAAPAPPSGIQDFRLSELSAPGGRGVHYHLSHLGRPLACLWLSATPPALIWREMHRACEHGADRIWIASVGDIKPAEIATEFFLQMAWDINRWTPGTLPNFLPEWAAREFGAENAPAIAALLNQYYLLNIERRPEHLQWWLPGEKPRPSDFTPADKNRRRALALAMNEQLAVIRDRIPPEKQDAFYQLVEYPVQGSILANQRYLTGEEAALRYLAGDRAALDKLGYEGDILNGQLVRITHRYNNLTSGGKWRHIMQLEPAGNEWRNMRISPWRVPNFQLPLPPEPKPPLATATLAATTPGAGGKTTWRVIPGLGHTGNALVILPAAAPPVPLAGARENAPVLEYRYALDAPAPDTAIARLHLVPAHAIDGSGKLRIAFTLDAAPGATAGAAPGDVTAPQLPQLAELDIDDGGPAWAQGVLANKRSLDIPLPAAARAPGAHTLRLYGIDPSLVLDRVTIESR